MEETRKVALDTDVLIDFLRGKDKAVRFIRNFKNKGVLLATTVINAFELYWGAYKFGGSRRTLTVDKLLDKLTILTMTVHEAKVAGEEIAYLEKVGLPIDVRDLLIGIIARENGYSVATGNITHLSRIRGISILKY